MTLFDKISELPVAKTKGVSVPPQHKLQVKVEKIVSPFSIAAHRSLMSQQHVLLSDKEGKVK